MARAKKLVVTEPTDTAEDTETEVQETPKTKVKKASDVEVPSFNLSAGNLDFESDEELEKELANLGGKFFDTPGNVDLEIVAAAFHHNKETGSIYCKGDSTWFNVKITLQGPGDKKLDHWIQVPTDRLVYGEKEVLGVYKKLQEFFFAIGEAVTIASRPKLCQKWFSDPSKLIGQKVNADLGYEGPYLAKAEDSEEYMVMVRGKPLQEDGEDVRNPDRDSARQYAKGRGIETGFVKVLKFTAKAVKTSKKTADNDW